MSQDDALVSPSVARNRDPILLVLRRVLAAGARVLEIASGSGEHAVHFARALRAVTWQPSDRDEPALRSIAAHRAAAALPNLLAPVRLDVADDPWPVAAADAVVSINMIHIAPPSATPDLMRGAAAALKPGGILVLYGPFREDDRATAPSNVAFDESLRARDPAWGLRRLADVAATAARHGFGPGDRIEMPANNLIVVFTRR